MEKNTKEDKLILESYLEETKDSLNTTTQELNEISASERKIRNTEIATGVVLVGALSLGTYLTSIGNISLGSLIQGGSIAFTAGFFGSTRNNKTKRKYKNAVKNKIKHLNLLKSALTDELQIEKEKSNEIAITKKTIEKTLTAEDLVYEYDANKEEMKENYKNKNFVEQSNYTELENKLFTRMIDLECNPKQKSLTK